MRQPRLVETSGYQPRDAEQKARDAEQKARDAEQRAKDAKQFWGPVKSLLLSDLYTLQLVLLT